MRSIVIGGNGSLTVACQLHDELGLPIVGVPKTIDNDIVGTDMTFGFNTAVQIATDAIDRLHTTAESHDRVMVVEVMGRHTGWIATHAGIAGGATVILIPEQPFDIDEVCHDPRTPSRTWPLRVDRRRRRGCRAAARARCDVGETRSTTSSATSASAGSPTPSPTRSRSAPASRRGWCCSATSSAAARRRRSTACCPPATAWPPSTPCTTRRGARWWCCAATR